MKANKIQIASIDDVKGARFEDQLIQDGDIVNFPMVIMTKEGILPSKSKRVCNFTPPLRFRNLAHVKNERQRSIEF
jgi:hypothetical protein